MEKELNGKKAIITGASTGIGAATAITFAREGASVIINYNRSADEAKKVQERAKSLGSDAYIFKADVTNEEEVKQLVEFTKDKFGCIEILVNNAGDLLERKALMETDLNYWKTHIDLNLTSAYIVTKNSVPLLLSSKSNDKAIINISSIAAVTGGGKGAAAYATAKGGLKTFTKALAKELSAYNIRVISVMPGLIVTPFHQKAKTEDIEGWANRQVLLKRAGKSEEVAEVIAFLASERASYINSTEIFVDGGWIMG
ncbi:MAG: SDR family NAD(P)-dependent oxidoreductase [Nitrososphaeria archaeon]|nr:SDR family oxidoreductase [Conexivisphaerales archaeon]